MFPPPKGVAVDEYEECFVPALYACQNNTPFPDKVQDGKNTRSLFFEKRLLGRVVLLIF